MKIDLADIIPMSRRRYSRKPDFNNFRQAVSSPAPGPLPVGDIFADMETVGNYLGERVFDYAKMASDPRHRVGWSDFWGALRYVDQTIRFCMETGWEYAYCFSSIPFQNFTYDLAENTADAARGRSRYWVNDNQGPIGSWDDFERYPWPKDIHTINLMARAMAKRVPDGMKVMVIPGGVFEWTTWLMGLVPFSYALVDKPDLVDAVIQKVADMVLAVVEDIIQNPGVGGVFMGDDLGFASGTMVSPRVLRTKFLPQTKRVVDLVHQAGKLFLFHSCGNMYAVMDDLCEMGIDGKHSFEDKIKPVEEVYLEWGNRTAIIGGVDIHLLASGTEAQVRSRTRAILDTCAPGGHYVLGTGNSVANYLPIQNYLAMLDEARKWNAEHFTGYN